MQINWGHVFTQQCCVVKNLIPTKASLLWLPLYWCGTKLRSLTMALILLVRELQCCVPCSLHPWQNSDQWLVFSLQSSCSSRGVDSLWRRSPHCIQLDFIHPGAGNGIWPRIKMELRFHLQSIRFRLPQGFTFSLGLCFVLQVQTVGTKICTFQSSSHETLICQRISFMPQKTRCLQGCGIFISKDLFTQLSCSAGQSSTAARRMKILNLTFDSNDARGKFLNIHPSILY